ncbi:MAG: hypothetical protein EPO24_03780 [Bacteroidetes bacterium]|nr:MAG: hypothetical protein EPO24_03780 [Bacteroidota bacterium]
MADVLLEKVEHIEQMLKNPNGKIDNFMGFEEITEPERAELNSIRQEIQTGDSMSFEDVFGKG